MDPLLGEIRLFPFSYAPNGWVLCDGRSLPIQQNAALYALIGITYGGDGKTNFNVPDLRGRTPITFGRSSLSNNIYSIGKNGGSEAVALNTTQVPSHSHTVLVSNSNGTANEPNDVLSTVAPSATGATISAYNTSPSSTTLNPATITTAGANQAHNNMSPYLVLNFCICVSGYFPSRP